MFIPGCTLCRTTTMNVNMSAKEARNKSKTITNMKFKTISEKRTFDCQGNNEEVSAHMNDLLDPVNIFLKRLRPDLNNDFENDEMFKKIIKIEKKEFSNTVRYYRKNYDPNFTTDQLMCLILEGTGEFNGVNQEDPHSKCRDRLMNNIPELGLSKFKIFHPTNDPRQFYLNKISMITPRFVKKYNYPLTTFVFSYDDDGVPLGKKEKGKKRQIYGATYNDVIENKSYNLVPRKKLTKTEMGVVIATCKKTIRHSVMTVNKSEKLETLEEIASKVDDMKKVFNIYNTSSIKSNAMGYNTTNKDQNARIETYLEGFKRYLDIQKTVNDNLNSNRITDNILGVGKIVKFCFTFKPHLFLSDEFNKNFARSLSKQNLGITRVQYFNEIIGENFENIVVVISVKK